MAIRPSVKTGTKRQILTTRYERQRGYGLIADGLKARADLKGEPERPLSSERLAEPLPAMVCWLIMGRS
jgi:hypothetical protein